MQTEIPVKILGYRKAQRYAVRRAFEQALQKLGDLSVGTVVTISEIKDVDEILRYTPVLIYPSLMIGGRLVCNGRIPRQQEVHEWLLDEISKSQQQINV